MSGNVGFPDPSAPSGGPTAVAEAVREVVRVGGRAICDDPRRVQGMLNDLLGASARSLRAEVDAVVVAADEAVPGIVLAGGTDEAALAVLADRGLGREAAGYAVNVWRYALGPAGDAGPPRSTERPAPIPTPMPTELPPGSYPGQTPMATELPYQSPYQPSPRVPSGTGHEHEVRSVDEQGGGGRRRLLLGGVVALIALVAAAAWVTIGRGDDPADPELAFDVELSDVGRVERRWVVEDGTHLVATLEVNNPVVSEAVSGTLHEPLPKTLAAGDAEVSSETDYDVIDLKDGEKVLAFPLEIPAGGRRTISYRVELPKDLEVGSGQLEDWQADQVATRRSLTQALNARPSLTISQSRSTVTTPMVELSGTVTDGAIVKVKGVGAVLDGKGRWSIVVRDLKPDTNRIAVVATSRYGVTTTKTATIDYDSELRVSISGPKRVYVGCPYRYVVNSNNDLSTIYWTLAEDDPTTAGQRSLDIQWANIGGGFVKVKVATADGRSKIVKIETTVVKKPTGINCPK
jgi:hypothetical protein